MRIGVNTILLLLTLSLGPRLSDAACPTTLNNGHLEIVAGTVEIDASAYIGCTDMKTVTIPSTVTKINEQAFSNSGLQRVVIPDSVKSIGDSAFFSNTDLANVTLGATLATLGASVFQSCISLQAIVIPDSVTSLGTNIFAECSSLHTVDIGDGISALPDAAFSHCRSLKTVTGSRILNDIGPQAFKASGLEKYTVPNTVTTIGTMAFDSSYNMKEITFSPPSSLQSIGKYAFSGASALKAISIPEDVTLVDQGAFVSCTELKYVYVNATRVDLTNCLQDVELASVYFSKNAILLENTNNEGIVCPQNSDPSSQEKCTCEGDYVNTLPESSPYFTCIARTPAPTPVPTVTPTLAPTTTSPTFAPTPLLECNSGTYKSNHQCEQCPVDTYSIGAVLECTACPAGKSTHKKIGKSACQDVGTSGADTSGNEDSTGGKSLVGAYAAVGAVFILVTILVAVYLYKEHVHEKEMEAESNQQAAREGGISVTENPMQQMPIIEEGTLVPTEMKIRTQRPSVSPSEAARMGSVPAKKSPLAGPPRTSAPALAATATAAAAAGAPAADPAVADPTTGDENL